MIRWIDRVSNVQVRNLALGIGSGNILSQRIELGVRHWLGHVLRVANRHLPYFAMFPVPPLSNPVRCQQMTWQRRSRKCAANLHELDVPRFRGWGPKDPSAIWLRTLRNKAPNHRQCGSRCHLLNQNDRKTCAFLQLDCILLVGYYSFPCVSISL